MKTRCHLTANQVLPGSALSSFESVCVSVCVHACVFVFVCVRVCMCVLAEGGQGRVCHELSSRSVRSHHPWPHPRKNPPLLSASSPPAAELWALLLHSCSLNSSHTVSRLWKERGNTQSNSGWTDRRSAAEGKVSLRSGTPLIACGLLRWPHTG